MPCRSTQCGSTTAPGSEPRGCRRSAGHERLPAARRSGRHRGWSCRECQLDFREPQGLLCYGWLGVLNARMPNRPLTVLFMPESAHGPTNNCIGIGDVLRRRGHRVVFAAEASWRGRLDALGFEEDLVDLAPPAEDGDAGDAGQFWKDFIRDTAPEFRKPTIEQLATFMQPTWQALIDGAMYCQPQLREILDRVRPDVIVEDNVIAFPALTTNDGPLRAHRLVQPARGPRPGHRTGLLRTARGRHQRVGGVPGGVRPHAPPHLVHLQRLGPGAGRKTVAGPRVRAHLRARQPVRLPDRGGLHRRASPRRDVAPARLQRPRHRRRLRGAGIPGRPPARQLGWSTCRSGSLGQRRRRSHAPARRGARPQSAPVHRVDGTAPRRS